MNDEQRADVQTRLSLETQKDAVRRHLKVYGSITPQGALAHYGSMRLGSIIHRLRQEWGKTAIRTDREGTQGYARYVLVRKEVR